MPALSRASGLAAVALVAVLGAGALMYFNSTGGPGGPPTNAPTNAPTTAATAQPTLPPGISGWKTFTSPVYGYTIIYPDDWSTVIPATQKWQAGEPEDSPSMDLIALDEGDEGASIAFLALQFPAPAGSDLTSWNGLLAAMTEVCAKPADYFSAMCPSEDLSPMCLGSTTCVPVGFVDKAEVMPRALVGDPETGMVMYIQMGRLDDYPGAERYGGTVSLLKAILSQLGIREPRPGEIPN